MQQRRAAIYARYSTDLQNERSVEDQIALCRDYAARNGLSIAGAYSDSARSGASILGRDGLIALLAQARTMPRPFDMVLVEHSDRLSRSMKDLADIHETMTFAGITIQAVHSGEMNTAMIGLFGLVGQMQREDGAKKVRRGMTGVVREGRSAGGRAYGYRPVPGRPGELVIDPGEEAVVLRIFTDYASGVSPRDIATRLNREGIAPPRGAQWNASTINGNLIRGHGLILNPIYRGELIWNRVKMVRDPQTGRRVSRPNPESEWIRKDAPHLRIVPPEIADAALARKTGKATARRYPAVRSARLLSGLLRCGHCGAAMVQNGKSRGVSRIVCSAAVESGTCKVGRRRVSLDAIEKTVINGLREQLGSPDAMAAYVETFNAGRAADIATASRAKAKVERRLAEIARETDRIVAAIGAGILEGEEAKRRLDPIRQERAKLEADLARADEDGRVVALHPAAVKAFRDDLAIFSEAFGEAVRESPEAKTAFRALIESVVVTIGEPYQPVAVEVRGRLSAILGEDLPPNVALVMVAGEGLEPPTRGL